MEKKENSFAVDFLMGGVAAAVSKTAAAPIERIKLLLQNQPEMLKSGRLDRPYEGIVDCFKRVRAEEGTISLWRGNNANVIRYFPTQALNFAYKDQYKKLFAVPKTATYTEKFLSNVLAGGLAGATSQVFVYSLDYARTRLANDSKAVSKGGERQFNGIIDVYKKTLNTDGIAGLYRGFTISVVGITIYRGLYFGLYDSLKPSLSFLESNPVSLGFASFLLGWGVTIAASMACYPIDTVRRRMMMTSGETEKYKSSMHAFSEILKKGGVQALFSGAGANILRAVAGAGALAGYDQLQFLFFNKTYSAGSG